MRIVHLMLSNYYADNFNYQENLLTRQNKIDGHEVIIVASTETIGDNKKFTYIKPGRYLNEDDILVIRLPYVNYFNHFVSRKVRHYPKVFELLSNLKPDIIFCHSFLMYEFRTVVNYIKKHPNVKLFVDSHSDKNNSARNFASRLILHSFFYRLMLNKSIKYIDEFLCVNYEAMIFLQEIYRIPKSKMKLYPLGGIILDEQTRESKRNEIRCRLGLREDHLLLMHAGKLTKGKRSIELLRALHNIDSDNITLLLAGSLEPEVEDSVIYYTNLDNRIKYLGWKNTSELEDLFCACDLYIQPGSQSVLMQIAMCCGCAVALFPHISHTYLLGNLAFYINSSTDIEELLNNLITNQELLREQRKKSLDFAYSNLDYKKLAQYIYK